MDMEQLKVGLFGYQKDSVYMLVASMEEAFSAKLMEKDAQNVKVLEEAQAKIAALEEELRALRSERQAQIDALEEELRVLRSERQAQHEQQDLISTTLLEAQAFAQKMRTETQEQEERLRSQLQEKAKQQKDTLERYTDQIRQLRGSFQQLLQTMDAQTGELERQAKDLSAAAPGTGANLSLLPKKTGTED